MEGKWALCHGGRLCVACNFKKVTMYFAKGLIFLKFIPEMTISVVTGGI